jgi:hypothetical protein
LYIHSASISASRKFSVCINVAPSIMWQMVWIPPSIFSLSGWPNLAELMQANEDAGLAWPPQVAEVSGGDVWQF